MTLETKAKSISSIATALGFSLLTLLFGYLSFGPWTSLIFSFGFLGGFFLWILLPSRGNYPDIQKPYWITFAVFILFHRVEENVLKFQIELSKITGHPVPELTSPWLILLLICSVGAWLSVPFFKKRNIEFGNYLAWSFFASMGVTELAHFVFPLLVSESYGYFPGMASVIVLAPCAWWGMYRLAHGTGKAEV